MLGEDENNSDYFMRRAAQEEAAATRATHPMARELHLELARRYRDASGNSSDSALELVKGAERRARETSGAKRS